MTQNESHIVNQSSNAGDSKPKTSREGVQAATRTSHQLESSPSISGMVETAPADSYNRELVRQVRPTDWKNPTSQEPYNLVVIGAGTAGLVTAAGAAGLGAKVALIEKRLLGGDCLNVGCVPSKAIISAARAVRAVRDAANFGVTLDGELHIDFDQVMAQMRETRAEISHHDSAHRFANLGVDVFFGHAEFVDRETVEVDGQELRFASAVIATGSRAAVPDLIGLDEVDFLTNETLFSLMELPASLGVIGGGPIGCEMAQAFQLLGSSVTLIEKHAHVLSKDDETAAAIVQQRMREDGIDILCGTQSTSLRKSGDSIEMSIADAETTRTKKVAKLLVAVGRRPNVEGMGLEKAGVDFDEHGIRVNQRSQTSNSKIFAAGDVCSSQKFTHAADFVARQVIQNSLFLGRKKTSDLVVPRCTYTSPELASVGLTEAMAKEQGVEVDSFSVNLTENDRAVLERQTDGLVTIRTQKGGDKILGATIVAANAGDLICEIAVAMTNNLTLSQLVNTIHPYPTHADAIRRLGDQYNRTRLTPFVSKISEKWLQWMR